MAQGSTVFPPGTDLHEVKTYMLSRMLWNASRDPLVEIGEFLPLYYGSKAAPYIKLYMDTMIQSERKVGFCRADDGRSLGFPPTAPFLTPGAILTAAQGFATAQSLLKGGESAAAKQQLVRVERASLSVSWVALVRWGEMVSFAKNYTLPWPYANSKREALQEFLRIGNETEQILGRGRDRLGRGPLSFYVEQIMNSSATDWCLPYVGPSACDPDWVNDQP